MAFDITKVSGQGMENLDSGSAIPFVRILQDLSPQLKKQKEIEEEFIKNLEIVFMNEVSYWINNYSLSFEEINDPLITLEKMLNSFHTYFQRF